jgi:hypothetical protein
MKKSAASRYSGLSVSLLEILIRRGIIKSALVSQPGSKRGARLINVASLDDYIESGVGKSADLEMNRTTH